MGKTLCQCQAGKEKATKKPSCCLRVSRGMQRRLAGQGMLLNPPVLQATRGLSFLVPMRELRRGGVQYRAGDTACGWSSGKPGKHLGIKGSV